MFPPLHHPRRMLLIREINEVKLMIVQLLSFNRAKIGPNRTRIGRILQGDVRPCPLGRRVLI